MNKTNVEKIQELMTSSPAGPLMQAFILEAARRVFFFAWPVALFFVCV